MLSQYNISIDFEERLFSEMKDNEDKQLMIDRLSKERAEVEKAIMKYEEELGNLQNEKDELVAKNNRMKAFLGSAVKFIQQNKSGFVGFLLINGYLSQLGFTLEDSIGDDSPLMRWINSLSVDTLVDTGLLEFFDDFKKAVVVKDNI